MIEVEIDWDDEGDYYIRMIIDFYEGRLAEKNERIKELEADIAYYRDEIPVIW